MVTKEIPELDEKGLRKFAYTSAALVVVLFGLLIPWLFGIRPVWPWVVAGGLALWGTVSPGSLKPVYKLWMRFGLVMNRITTPIILGLIFFVVLAPIAFFMRLFGRDTLKLNLNKESDSYRIESDLFEKNTMERPY